VPANPPSGGDEGGSRNTRTNAARVAGLGRIFIGRLFLFAFFNFFAADSRGSGAALDIRILFAYTESRWAIIPASRKILI
jgi:hypothetical protein